MSTQDFINRLIKIRDDLNDRLNSLIKFKFLDSPIKFEDIDERIDDCVKAIDNLDRSINRMLSQK